MKKFVKQSLLMVAAAVLVMSLVACNNENNENNNNASNNNTENTQNNSANSENNAE